MAIYLAGAIMLVVGVTLFVLGYKSEYLYATLGNLPPVPPAAIIEAVNLEGAGSIIATIGFILFISGIAWKPKS